MGDRATKGTRQGEAGVEVNTLRRGLGGGGGGGRHDGVWWWYRRQKHYGRGHDGRLWRFCCWGSNGDAKAAGETVPLVGFGALTSCQDRRLSDE
jgi:hypothetical protein